jgi:hypothetical protein
MNDTTQQFKLVIEGHGVLTTGTEKECLEAVRELEADGILGELAYELYEVDEGAKG